MVERNSYDVYAGLPDITSTLNTDEQNAYVPAQKDLLCILHACLNKRYNQSTAW
jgi:hypothetical protein